MSYKEREIADDLALACRVLGANDMTVGALGHVSYRMQGEDAMLIKGKGPDHNVSAIRYDIIHKMHKPAPGSRICVLVFKINFPSRVAIIWIAAVPAFVC